MNLRLLTILAVALASPAMAQPCSACKPGDGDTLVCPNGKSTLHTIHGTVSPGNHYAVAIDGEADGDESPTFLVRLADGKILTKLKGKHLGDRARYNHRIARAVWSPNEKWMAAVYDDKWDTTNADAYRLDSSAFQPADLLKLCRDAELNYFKREKIKVEFGHYKRTVSVKSIGDDGMLAALCSMQVMKEDDSYSFAVRIKLAPSAKGAVAAIQSVKRCKDDDESEDCTAAATPE